MMEILASGAAALGIPLTDAQLAAFNIYATELLDWNEKFNLTAIRDVQEVQTRHFLDSIAMLPILARFEKVELAELLSKPRKAADVGPGPGFPGLALKILWPGLRLTLIEATEKKLKFMKHVAQLNGLRDIQFVHARAEDAGAMPEHREAYELVTARAVAPMPALVEYMLPLVKMYGRAIAYKGPAAAQETTDAANGLKILGGRLREIVPVDLPGATEARALVFMDKIKVTPKSYPRGNGLPRKKPL